MEEHNTPSSEENMPHDQPKKEEAPKQPETLHSIPKGPEVIKEIHHHHHYEKRGFGIFRLLVGLFVVLVGLAWLSSSMGWHWGASVDVFRLWPILIIFFGLSLLSRGSAVLRTISAILIFLVFVLVAALIFWPGRWNRTEVTRSIDIAHEAAATQTDLALRLGAVDLTVRGNTDKAVAGTFTSSLADLTQTSTLTDGIQHVTLAMDTQHGWWMMPFGGNPTTLNVNASTTVPLALRLDGGAMNATMDFTSVPLRTLDVNSGATTLNVTFGDLLDTSDVTIDAGASTIHVNVPTTVGVRLNIDSGLTTKDISDFNKIDDKHYESSNLAVATKIINLNLKLGASTLTVDWQAK